MISSRIIFLTLLFALASFAGWSSYLYFFDTTQAILQLQGISESHAYTGDIACLISSNKKGTLSLFLDDTQLTSNFHIAASEEYPFIIPTKAVSNGLHTCKASFTDNRFAQNRSEIELTFVVDNQPLQAAILKQEEVLKVFQGKTLKINIQVNKPIESIVGTFLSHEYSFFQESENGLVYEVYIPIDCQENPSEYLFTAVVKDKVGTTLALETPVHIISFPFKKHTLHVSDQKMEEEEQMGPDSQMFEVKMREITNNSIKKKLWRGTFCTPMDIAKITCEFGTVRTTQQKGRYAHRAIDAINTPRCVVWAPQNGKIALKERFAFTGNTVVIDHGHGVISMLCHLDSFAKISVGDFVKQGNPIGTMGKTGYATGYHLHWEMRIGNIPIDPLQWTRASFQ